MILSPRLRSIIAAISGNFVEWFDFALYLFLAPVLAKQFFPDVGSLALIGTFTVYAVSFFFRPLGAILFGHIGDRYGRGIALRLSLSVLALMSIVIACLPSYASIGSVATIALCVCRIIQGICLGGEFAGSMVYLGETAPSHQRSLVTALTNNASNLGILVAAGSTSLLSALMSPADFESYGFRCLFFAGGLLGILGFTLRSDLKETPAFLENSHKEKFPLTTLLTQHRGAIRSLFMILMISALGSYAFIGFMSTFLCKQLDYSLAQATRYETAFIALTLVLVPLFARYADKYSPKTMLKWACLTYLILAIPCYYLFYTYEQPLFLIPLVAAYSAEQSCVPALLMEYFPTATRYSGVSLTYNSCMAFIGGLSPLLGVLMLLKWQMPYGIGYLLMMGAGIALLSLQKRANSLPDQMHIQARTH